MELTGKCKAEFEKWYFKRYGVLPEDFSNEATFWELDDNMKFGVFQDYFDSVGVMIDLQPVCDYNKHTYTKLLEFIVHVFGFNIDYKTKDETITKKTRPEARTKSVIKADEIRNEQL